MKVLQENSAECVTSLEPFQVLCTYLLNRFRGGKCFHVLQVVHARCHHWLRYTQACFLPNFTSFILSKHSRQTLSMFQCCVLHVTSIKTTLYRGVSTNCIHEVL